MPAIPTQSKVLVTGASGFIGSHVVKALLERGFAVRGTVRSTAKGEYLKKLFGSEKFEYTIVEDMSKENAYDEAVKGVDAVEHVASPLSVEGTTDPEAWLAPAVGGTAGILKSIKRNGQSVKRVVVTSSMAAVGGLGADQWNQAAVDAVRAKGAEVPGFVAYAASKVLAERAAWEFVEKHKNEINFDLVTTCPPWVFGPMIHEGTALSSINESNWYLLANIDRSKRKEAPAAAARDGSFTDVRDIAAIQADVLLCEEAGGKRLITTPWPFCWQDVYDIVDNKADLTETDEARAKRHGFAVADHSGVLLAFNQIAAEVFRPSVETIKDTMESASQRGWKGIN